MLGRIYAQAASFFSGLACPLALFQVHSLASDTVLPIAPREKQVTSSWCCFFEDCIYLDGHMAMDCMQKGGPVLQFSRKDQDLAAPVAEPRSAIDILWTRCFCITSLVTGVSQLGAVLFFFEASWLQDSSGTRGWQLGNLEGRSTHSPLFWTRNEWVEDQTATEKEGQKNQGQRKEMVQVGAGTDGKAGSCWSMDHCRDKNMNSLHLGLLVFSSPALDIYWFFLEKRCSPSAFFLNLATAKVQECWHPTPKLDCMISSNPEKTRWRGSVVVT